LSKKVFASIIVIRLSGNRVPCKKEIPIHKNRKMTSMFMFLKS